MRRKVHVLVCTQYDSLATGIYEAQLPCADICIGCVIRRHVHGIVAAFEDPQFRWRSIENEKEAIVYRCQSDQNVTPQEVKVYLVICDGVNRHFSESANAEIRTRSQTQLRMSVITRDHRVSVRQVDTLVQRAQSSFPTPLQFRKSRLERTTYV